MSVPRINPGTACAKVNFFKISNHKIKIQEIMKNMIIFESQQKKGRPGTIASGEAS